MKICLKFKKEPLFIDCDSRFKKNSKFKLNFCCRVCKNAFYFLQYEKFNYFKNI